MTNPRFSSSNSLQGGSFSEQRCYACNFCKREFRNAQALGGHMNVHRRERAMAKQLVELQQQPGPDNHKLGSVAVPGAAALINPLGGEVVVEAHQQQDVITYDTQGESPGSSSSWCSPPSQASTTLNSLVNECPCPSLEQALFGFKDHCDSVDIELRLGPVTPETELRLGIYTPEIL